MNDIDDMLQQTLISKEYIPLIVQATQNLDDKVMNIHDLAVGLWEKPPHHAFTWITPRARQGNPLVINVNRCDCNGYTTYESVGFWEDDGLEEPYLAFSGDNIEEVILFLGSLGVMPEDGWFSVGQMPKGKE